MSRIHRLRPLAMLTLCLLPSLVAAGQPAAGPVQSRYVEVASYIQDDAAYEAWLGLRTGLVRDFDAICGDTFCEGDFSNLQPLRFQCSVKRSNGRIGTCVWSFAASNEHIDPITGGIRVDAQAWRCRTPLAVGTTLEELLSTLAGEHPLHTMLPRSERSIYDGLGDCF